LATPGAFNASEVLPGGIFAPDLVPSATSSG
jgi:hypothetical protein